MNIVYLGLGSNVGDRQLNLDRAISLLAQHPNVEVQGISESMENPAVSYFKQDDFINLCMKINTICTPMELLDITESIEKQLGRQSKGTYDPRTIDIDILLYNDEIISTERLTVPHPVMHERNFVLSPLIELDPELMHPILNMSVQECRDILHEQYERAASSLKN